MGVGLLTQSQKYEKIYFPMVQHGNSSYWYTCGGFAPVELCQIHIYTRRRRFWLVACGLKTCARFIFILLAIRPFPPGYDKAWVMLYVSAFSSAAVNSLLQMIGSLPCSLLGVTSGFSICIHPFAKSFRENILTINPPQ